MMKNLGCKFAADGGQGPVSVSDHGIAQRAKLFQILVPLPL